MMTGGVRIYRGVGGGRQNFQKMVIGCVELSEYGRGSIPVVLGGGGAVGVAFWGFLPNIVRGIIVQKMFAFWGTFWSNSDMLIALINSAPRRFPGYC